ncbi:MAG: hypothetical protein L6R38_008138 [Xanthoria sp. 2 TBL-2021]|nr:MAG: hypothetical protein L6R38_008138 [Xanthoria sp. 2 TBL-2021]
MKWFEDIIQSGGFTDQTAIEGIEYTSKACSSDERGLKDNFGSSQAADGTPQTPNQNCSTPAHNGQMQGGRTPLHTAAYHGNHTAVLCMLRAGAKTKVADAWRDTPLHSAARCESTLVTKSLLDYGADVTARSNSGKMAGEIMIDEGLGDLLDLDSDDDKDSMSILMDHDS